jgi:hypothetical protein
MRSQRFFALDSIGDVRPTGFVLVLNDGYVCIESSEVCLFALLIGIW